MTPRERVWLALSDLFLDTDVNLFHENTVRVLFEAPFGLATLDRMFIDEVFPVCIFNLYDVAGEWAGFPEAWLFPAIEAQNAKWRPMFKMQRPQRNLTARAMVPEWFVVRDRLVAMGKT